MSEEFYDVNVVMRSGTLYVSIPDMVRWAEAGFDDRMLETLGEVDNVRQGEMRALAIIAEWLRFLERDELRKRADVSAPSA